jgi:hypothetical protein
LQGNEFLELDALLFVFIGDAEQDVFLHIGRGVGGKGNAAAEV